jgi:hypothetical protein
MLKTDLEACNRVRIPGDLNKDPEIAQLVSEGRAMILDEKTRFQIVALGLGIVLVVGFAIFRATDKPQRAATLPQAASAPGQPPASVSEPGRPNLSIQGENAVVAGTGGHATTVTGDPNLSYVWTIRGGTLESGSQGPTVTWSAGTGPDVIVICKGTNPEGKSSEVSMQIVVRQAPVISRFESVPAVVTEGSSAKLTWTATNVSSLTLDPGNVDVTKSPATGYDVTPPETMTYRLQAANNSGAVAAKEYTLKVVPRPVIVALRADPVVGSPETINFVGEFQNGKADLKQDGNILASSDISPLVVRVTNVKEGSSLTFMVTNEAGTFATTSLSVVAGSTPSVITTTPVSLPVRVNPLLPRNSGQTIRRK